MIIKSILCFCTMTSVLRLDEFSRVQLTFSEASSTAIDSVRWTRMNNRRVAYAPTCSAVGMSLMWVADIRPVPAIGASLQGQRGVINTSAFLLHWRRSIINMLSAVGQLPRWNSVVWIAPDEGGDQRVIVNRALARLIIWEIIWNFRSMLWSG